MADKELSAKVVATNRRARHEYFIEETYEAGIALTGTEIQSVRQGRVSLADAYAEVRNGEVLMLTHISPNMILATGLTTIRVGLVNCSFTRRRYGG
jgi:tmRNA-binding protein